MIEQLIVTTERVDDLPLLIASMDQMGLAELLDAHFVPHGNWQRLSNYLKTSGCDIIMSGR